MLSVCILSAVALLTYSQNELEQAEGRIFDDNPCHAPCWHHLYAGESTFIDTLVVAFFNGFKNIKSINFEKVILTTDDGFSTSSISLRAGVVRSIVVSMAQGETFTLENILNTMGEPSLVKVDRFPGDVYMQFFYKEFNMVIHFFSSAEICNLNSFTQDYQARFVIYNSPGEFYPPWSIFPSSVPLTDTEWREWRSGEIDANCSVRIYDIAERYYQSEEYSLTQTPIFATREANAIQLTEYAATQTAIAPTLTATATPTP